jgi:hypothetical protein
MIVYVCMYVCMCMCIYYIYMCVCIYICMYIYICVYALPRSTFNVFSMVVAVFCDRFLVLDFELLFSNVLCGL